MVHRLHTVISNGPLLQIPQHVLDLIEGRSQVVGDLLGEEARSEPTPKSNPAICPREDDLLDALARGFVDSDLATHAAACPACAELPLVAGGLLDDRAAAIAEAPVPSAGTMWWRLKIRQRQEAEARARGSLLVGQAATLAVALALVVGLFGGDLAEALRGLAGTVRVSTPLLVAVGVWVLVVPLAGWVRCGRSEGGRLHRQEAGAGRSEWTRSGRGRRLGRDEI